MGSAPIPTAREAANLLAEFVHQRSRHAIASGFDAAGDSL
jgi:hypothetical protein